MKSKAIWTSAIVFLFLTGLLTIAAPAANAKAKHVRWDIVSRSVTTSLTGSISAGGSASASANGIVESTASDITLTGTGTFVAPASGGGSKAVTGGGTWTIDIGGIPSASGTYKVKGLVRFDEALGTLVGTTLTDNIDDIEDLHAGLAVLTILYSDGARGILVVSCNLPGTPATVFEGITVSKGPVDFWNREAPVAGVDENRTAFHIKD